MAKKPAKQDEYQARAREAGVKVRHIIDAASGEVTEVAENVENRINQKPVESSLIAMGVGLFLGLLLGGRR